MEEIKRALKNGSIENLLNAVSSLLPPSDDVAIEIAKRGVHQYILDRRGFAMVSTNEDEYLPYLSSHEKRLTFSQLPKDVIREIDPKKILSQLYDILNTYGARNKIYREIAEKVGSILEDK
ncbi:MULTISPECIES: hypothetical protein [Acidianus]|uniref:Uncharacterized protein n=1 Tax=Candidatus Acidianus copahuensis TaxID=1160895 RepID=A0A031LKS8_9CREN|nr:MULTISPECIES: hypothetical protein [Acidianus]EZQ02100.1 hypothetical protein CM19_11600 [Candidatus Acidianus copahuensis]NON62763.1 hypothetical protein [Acidianus sp. RZ1]